MSRSKPGTLCLRTWSAPGTLYLSARSAWGTHITLSGFPECSGHSNKEFPELSGSSNKEYPVCSGSSNDNLFADFQLPIVIFFDFFPQKFQHKNERPIYPFSSVWYKFISSSVAQHWTCLLDFVTGGGTFCSFCQNMGLFYLPDKIIILHKIFSCATYCLKSPSFGVKTGYTIRIFNYI